MILIFSIFENYGHVVRCELKQGTSSNFCYFFFSHSMNMYLYTIFHLLFFFACRSVTDYASSYGFLEFESSSDAQVNVIKQQF